MDPGVAFTGRYSTEPLAALTPGAWYLGFACRRCAQHFAIANEPTNTGRLGISGDAMFRVDCPNCGETNEQSAAELVAFQAAQGGPSSTA